jgi:hypothetical protein
MADNYSQFSEVFTFKTEEAARMFMKLGDICTAYQDGDIAPEELNATGADADALDADQRKMWATWSFLTLDRRVALLEAFEPGRFEYEPHDDLCSVWVYSEEYGNLDAVAECAREVLAFTDDSDTVFTLTWSETCSKPRFGEFGGGYMVIHAGGVEYGNVWDLAKEAAAKVKSEK